MPLPSEPSDLQGRLQAELLPEPANALGPLTAKSQLVVTSFEMVPVGAFFVACPGVVGRPLADRVALRRSLIAKSVHAIPLTSLLIERLHSDRTMRTLCGWSHAGEVPSEATFSRACAEFAASELPTRIHAALITATHEDRLGGHISRDSTAITARERPVEVEAPKRCRKKQAPRRGEPGWENVRRLERQGEMTLGEMLADRPRHRAVGVKPDAQGRKSTWVGYKLHLDVADGGIPPTGLLTSASLHDSQAAIPMALMSAQRVTALCELMDSACQAPEIVACVRALGRVPIIPAGAQGERPQGRARRSPRARARCGRGDVPHDARCARTDGRPADAIDPPRRPGCHPALLTWHAAAPREAVRAGRFQNRDKRRRAPCQAPSGSTRQPIAGLQPEPSHNIASSSRRV